MIIHKIGDVLKQEDAKYICHQVNCKGVMGAGLAKQIKPLLTPKQFDSYRQACLEKGEGCLGQIQVMDLPDGRTIINIFGKNIPTGTLCDTDYPALFKGLETAKNLAIATGNSLAIPGFIGCGLAGGDWHFVYRAILESLFKDCNIALYVYWLNEELYQEGLEIFKNGRLGGSQNGKNL